MPGPPLGVRCPGCQQIVRAAVDVEIPEASPNPGDGSRVMCGTCGHVGVFVDGPLGFYIRDASIAELQTWAADPRIQEAAARVRQLRAAWHDRDA